MLQGMITQAQNIQDPMELRPTLTSKLAQAKAKLTFHMPLSEQLQAATEAHTQAQSAVLHFT